MAMIKPIALSKNAFDAIQDQIFYFNVSGGNQVVKNKITIRNNATNEVIYTNTVESYKFQQTIPAGTLTNGVYYNYYFNTYDVNNNISENSNVISFYCFTTPTLVFTNIPSNNKIENATFNFVVQYSQEQNELLEFVKINLYSSSNQLIATSGNLYSSETPPLTLNYTFEGMENNTSYKIQATGNTTNGTIIESNLINFSVVYSAPSLYNKLVLENKCNEGYVQVRGNLIVADGISNINPMIYIDNTKVDIRFPQDYIRWQQGYQIEKDFEISIWMNPTWIYNFCKMFGTNTNGYTMNFVREIPYGETTVKDYFELKGYVDGNLKVYQRSNYIDIMSTNDSILVWVKKIGTNYTLTLQVVTRGEPSFISWNIGSSNIDYNTLTNLNWVEDTYIEGTQPTLLSEDMDSIFPLTSFELSSGIYDNLDITKDVTKEINVAFPTWNNNTELNCDFNENISGGNIGITSGQLTYIKVKRRKNGTFNWITLYNKKINTLEDLSIDLQDSYIPSEEEFQWAIVPILTNEVEGNYIIEGLKTKLNGTFLSNEYGKFKLYNSVVYGSATQNLSIGQVQPIGLEYPIIIQNGKVNNYSNTFSADLYGYKFEETRNIDRKDVMQQSNDLLKFLSMGKSFCITDWNGNIYIGRINGNPTLTYNSSYGNGIINISFPFVEQGKYDNQNDMYRNGLINILD